MEMKIKTPLKFCIISVRMVKINKTTAKKTEEDMEKGNLNSLLEGLLTGLATLKISTSQYG